MLDVPGKIHAQPKWCRSRGLYNASGFWHLASILGPLEEWQSKLQTSIPRLTTGLHNEVDLALTDHSFPRDMGLGRSEGEVPYHMSDFYWQLGKPSEFCTRIILQTFKPGEFPISIDQLVGTGVLCYTLRGIAMRRRTRDCIFIGEPDVIVTKLGDILPEAFDGGKERIQQC